MSTDQTPDSSNALASRTVLILGGVAAIALLAVIVLAILLFRASGRETAVGGTVTPFATAQTLNVPNNPLVVGLDGSSTISLTLDAPVILVAGGQTYNVQTQVVTADRIWSPTLNDSGQAIWVYGTIVNYVLGLPDSGNNRSVLEQLQPDDEFLLETRSGKQYRFSFESRQNVPTTDRDVFSQTFPGMTLLLLGSEGNERLVVNGRYIVSDEDTNASNVIGLGETAQLENVQITVPSVAYVPEPPEVPPGFAFFQVDYEIQNVGLTAFDTSQLQLTLVDSIGNQYAINPIASQIGNYPPLSGFLNAGQIRQATAGYQIPVGLNSDTLSWIAVKTDTGAQLQVAIPFTGSAAAAERNSDVSLFQAEVGIDLTTLLLSGQIVNLNTQPIVVTQAQLTLGTSDGASYLLLSSNPPLRWTVAPGETRQFAVTYQRPATETAVFTVLSHSFQLSGLR